MEVNHGYVHLKEITTESNIIGKVVHDLEFTRKLNILKV